MGDEDHVEQIHIAPVRVEFAEFRGPRVELGPREGGHEADADIVQGEFQGEIDGHLQGFPSLARMAEDEEPLAPDPRLPAQAHRLTDLVQRHPLVDQGQDLRAAAFDAEADLPAAGLPHQLEIFRRDVVDPAEAAPGDAEPQIDEPLADLLQPGLEGDERIVLEAELPDAVAPVQFDDLPDHVVRRVGMTAGPEHRAVAEDAGVGAAPRGDQGGGGELLHLERRRQIALREPLQQVPGGNGRASRSAMKGRRPVSRKFVSFPEEESRHGGKGVDACSARRSSTRVASPSPTTAMSKAGNRSMVSSGAAVTCGPPMMTVRSGNRRFAAAAKEFALKIARVVEERQRMSGPAVASRSRSSGSVNASAEASTTVQAQPSSRATAASIRMPSDGTALPPPAKEP
jgi:hypothetical protein